MEYRELSDSPINECSFNLDFSTFDEDKPLALSVLPYNDDSLAYVSPPELVLGSITPLSSTLTTPLLEDESNIASTDVLDLDALLAAPMYDDVNDKNETLTSPLFSDLTPEYLNEVPNSTDTKRKASEIEDSSPVLEEKRMKREACATSDISPVSTVEAEEVAKVERRARNTAAARRSRDKKRERMSVLEARVAELERLNTLLTVENQVLRTLKSMPARESS